ncbi:serine/threonine-protein phosphatase 6 regulatory ankyrin repeat subunit B-like [Haliotis rubra]|uniref:serine/threonine-protein phosphatase 6 regulatory ankyrin repeat subunit B-like n=1 Tax=Haliotis rubra TaxID=36100 RepID=UPI001EE5C8EB|nr:serine/threonine-protein phosphatase 6 regulatory ankyrin repeat subunit B-like [Haliotis rubra]
MKLISYDRNSMLLQACLDEKVLIVKELLSSSSVDINTKAKAGWTPVLIAAFKGNVELFTLLVKEECDLSNKLDDGKNILHVACLSDNVDIAEYLLSHGISNIDSTDKTGRTPVICAAEKGSKKVFDLLVSKGCNLSVVDDLSRNILHVACLSDNVDLVKDLISHGITDIESRGEDGATPVMYAAEKGNKRVVDLLVNKGCKLSVVDDRGRNILHVACLSDNVDLVKDLISHGIADIESRGEDGATPVMYAAEKGNKRVVDLLVNKGCKLSVVDDRGRNILHVACLSDNVHIVEDLFLLGIADIESRGKDGGTSVMYAAEQGNKRVVDLLMNKGCKLSVVDDRGRNILHAACFSDNVHIVEDLFLLGIADIESRGKDGGTSVMYAAEKGNKRVVDLLMNKGCILSVVDDRSKNILHAACMSDNADIVEDLLSRGIAGIESKDKNGATPVMYAAEKGNKKVVDLLVSKGCNLSVVDDLGRNILHAACLSDNVDIVEDLLRHGIVDIESKDKNGATPVMYAAEGQ